MKRILLVKSSVRDGRVADKVSEITQSELQNFPDFEVSVVDFKQTPLPFFDSAHTPSSEEFKPTDANVIEWTKQVGEADVVVLLVAEYNHSYTSVLKNAIDWIYKEWNNKPVVFIGYGWVGGARAIKHLREVFASNVSAQTQETEANLRFMKELNPDGTVLDQASVSSTIKAALDQLK